MFRLKRYISALVVIILFGANLSGVFKSTFAQEQGVFILDESALKVKAATEVAEIPQSKGEQLIEKLNKQLSASKSSYDQLNGNVSKTKDRLKKTESELRTLEEQMAILDEEIESTTNTVNNIRYQISKSEVELTRLLEAIELKALELEDQRKILGEYAQFIYYQKNVFYEEGESALKPIKFLLADNSVSNNLRDEMYLQLMEKQSYEIFDRLAQIAESMELEKAKYEKEKINLDELNARLTIDLEVLQDQMQAKQDLYDTTKGQEEIFKQLIVYAKIEQQQIDEEIKQLSINVDYLKDKLGTISDSELTKIESDINDFIKKNYLLGITAGDLGNLPQFSWPVLPKQGLSAYFHDESYHAHFGIAHNAIDIPVPQGSPIHAPAPGVVTKAVDAGLGYSYIMITHQDGFATVYGHVFNINVREGDVIHRGDVIGLSGGAPGTKGAGLLTTGPHLHFEIYKNGKHVDPLFFLPLRYLDKSLLDDKYHELYDLEQEKLKEQFSSGASEMIDSYSRQVDEEIRLELESELGLTPSN